MRLILLIVGGVAVGALSAVGIQWVFPQTAQTFQSVRADVAGFSLTNLKTKLSELNPLRKTYDDVMRKVTAGGGTPDWAVAKGPTFNMKPIDLGALNSGLKIDNQAIQRSIAAGINARIQQDYRRSQDLIAYGRNPMGWHGPPPH
jgi:hypothetical protein